MEELNLPALQENLGQVMDFVEEHLPGASPAEQDVLLTGLYGFIQNTDEELDWNRIASFYQAAHQDVPEYVQQHL